MVVHQFFSDFKCLPFRCKVKALASLFFFSFFFVVMIGLRVFIYFIIALSSLIS